jgi:hypothetical protein
VNEKPMFLKKRLRVGDLSPKLATTTQKVTTLCLV